MGRSPGAVTWVHCAPGRGGGAIPVSSAVQMRLDRILSLAPNQDMERGVGRRHGSEAPGGGARRAEQPRTTASGPLPRHARAPRCEARPGWRGTWGLGSGVLPASSALQTHYCLSSGFCSPDINAPRFWFTSRLTHTHRPTALSAHTGLHRRPPRGRPRATRRGEHCVPQ